jgi:two-component system response regulator GlrR
MGSGEDLLGREAVALGEPVGRRRDDRIVGASPSTLRAVEQARAAARTEIPVWLVGPPGSGKAILARAIHAWSGRREHRFETLTCGGIPPALQARELFGCSAGLHPTLPAAYEGLLAATAGGTLFLDGSEALEARVRAALLESLEKRRYRREGDGSERTLASRVLASTRAGEAWFGALPHHEIRLLPLAERSEDILPLAAHFLATFAAEAGRSAVGFTQDARAWLVAEPWPGNVRELRERVRHAVGLAGQGAISAESLLLGAEDGGEVPSFKEAKRAFETRYVIGLLRRCRGNISRAARLAKKDRKDFYDVIRRTGVDPQQYR